MNKFTPNGKQQAGFHPGDSWRTPNFTADLTKCVSPKGDLDLTGFCFLDGNEGLMVDTAKKSVRSLLIKLLTLLKMKRYKWLILIMVIAKI